MNEEQTDFAAQPNIAIFTSVDGKGRPHATPIWYLFTDGDFIFSVGRGSQKHRNVERNPEISVVIDSREVPYYALMISGPAMIEPPLGEDQRLEMAVRYLGEAIGMRYAEATKDSDAVTLRLKPRKVIEYTGRARRSA